MDRRKSKRRQRSGKSRIRTILLRAPDNANRYTMAKWLTVKEALRVAEIHLHQLLAQQFAVQEYEQRRIARELHDGLGQSLALAKLTMQRMAYSINAGDVANTGIALKQATSEIQAAIDETRRMAMNLRPATLDDLGLVATMRWYRRQVEAAHPGILVQFDIRAKEIDVPDPIKITIFRIVQEAVGNALKHADADRLDVHLTIADEMLTLEVIDNGKGFDPDVVAAQREFAHGIGLQSMKERAELSGGSYYFHTTLGRGTRIDVKWPKTQTLAPECAAVSQ